MKRSERSQVVMPSELINVEHPFYDSPTVHLEMINDKIRTEAFRKAIKDQVKKNDIVIEIGTGTGILSIFAAKSGAKKVYATEAAGEMFEAAKKIIKNNKYGRKIKLVKYRGRKIKFSRKANVIVSECLGHFGFDENMIAAVDEYKKSLKKGGVFIPKSISLFMAPIQYPFIYNRYLKTWEQKKYDIDFSYMKKIAAEKIYIFTCNPSNLLSNPVNIINYALGKQTMRKLVGKQTMLIKKTGFIHGLVGWFECELGGNVSLSTSPYSEKTHWEQSFLPFQLPLSVKKGEEFEVALTIDSIVNTNVIKFSWQLSKNNKILRKGKASI